ELLRFEEAKQEHEAAQQIHMPLVQSFEGRGPIDELFPKKLLWGIAFAKAPLREETSQALFQSVFAPLTLNMSPVLLGLFAAGVIVIRLTVSRKITASGCALCGRPICFHCQRRVLDLKTCDTCWGGSKNVKRKKDLRPLKMRQRRIHQWAQWISVAFPGSGHLYLGRGVRGFIFSGFFIGILFTLLFRNRFFQSPGEPAGILGFVGMTGIITGLVVLYIQVFRDLVKASHEKP
ncbi:MAG TPA: hypothetical protein VI588_02160, partial [Candidatus Gracilibacteria bacterium]|nr:hypothetical protein [Candidatus Gracilibacteria bacterium]